MQLSTMILMPDAAYQVRYYESACAGDPVGQMEECRAIVTRDDIKDARALAEEDEEHVSERL